MYDYMYGRSVITNGYYNSNCFSQMGISKHDNSEFKDALSNVGVE